ncbi:hypothetical protein PO124_21400 [Bacillus licheniformis]|nr:hypothetical protein [Bacillus licheniformis]
MEGQRIIVFGDDRFNICRMQLKVGFPRRFPLKWNTCTRIMSSRDSKSDGEHAGVERVPALLNRFDRPVHGQ